MTTLRKTKICNCCRAAWDSVPADHALGVKADFFWFNCDCGSTLVVPEIDTTDEGPLASEGPDASEGPESLAI